MIFPNLGYFEFFHAPKAAKIPAHIGARGCILSAKCKSACNVERHKHGDEHYQRNIYSALSARPVSLQLHGEANEPKGEQGGKAKAWNKKGSENIQGCRQAMLSWLIQVIILSNKGSLW